MKPRMFLVLVGVAILVAGAAAFAIVTANGFSTRTPPTAIERVLARAIRRWSVPVTARDASNPVAFSPAVWAEARAHFADHCASCHGNDGSGDIEIGRNLYP